MLEAVYDSHKWGVERNVLCRLLTLICVFLRIKCWQASWGERLCSPGTYSQRPDQRFRWHLSIFFWFNIIFDFTSTHSIPHDFLYSYPGFYLRNHHIVLHIYWNCKCLQIEDFKKFALLLCRHNEILNVNILCVQISFEVFFGDFGALFREIGTMYFIQSIAHLFLLPLTIFQAAYRYRI